MTAQLRSGRDEIPTSRLPHPAASADGIPSRIDAAHVAAAVLQPAARADARRLLVREGQYDVWSRWASMVHEPARGLLLEPRDARRSVG